MTQTEGSGEDLIARTGSLEWQYDAVFGRVIRCDSVSFATGSNFSIAYTM